MTQPQLQQLNKIKKACANIVPSLGLKIKRVAVATFSSVTMGLLMFFYILPYSQDPWAVASHFLISFLATWISFLIVIQLLSLHPENPTVLGGRAKVFLALLLTVVMGLFFFQLVHPLFLLAMFMGLPVIQLVKPFSWREDLDSLLANYEPVDTEAFKSLQRKCSEAEGGSFPLQAVIEWEEKERNAVSELMGLRSSTIKPQKINLQKFLSRSL